jgi:hypothetical protein
MPSRRLAVGRKVRTSGARVDGPKLILVRAIVSVGWFVKDVSGEKGGVQSGSITGRIAPTTSLTVWSLNPKTSLTVAPTPWKKTD